MKSNRVQIHEQSTRIPVFERKRYKKGGRRLRLIVYVFIVCGMFYFFIHGSLMNSFQQFEPIYNSIFMRKSIDSNVQNTGKLEKQSFSLPLSEHQPHLPHPVYFRPTIPSGSRPRLILLANGFFGSRNWFYQATDNVTNTFMQSVYCPLLPDYCNVTSDMTKISIADALVFHGRDYFDKRYFDERRRPEQRAVFALWESPSHTCNLEQYRGFFNWTMTYRLDSDIVTTYASNNPYIHVSNPYYQMIKNDSIVRGYTVPFTTADHILSQEAIGKKIGTVAVLMSNCYLSERMVYIENLGQYVDVHVFGGCGQRCPDNVDCRQYIAEKYYFFLSFENSMCTDYISEKVFLTIKQPIVPVVMGKLNYSVFIPPSGYVNTRDYQNVMDLAKFLNETRYNTEKYLSFFKWKEGYVWISMNYYFYFCDLCVHLHLENRTQIVDDLHGWWFNNSCESKLGAAQLFRAPGAKKVFEKVREDVALDNVVNCDKV